MHEHHKEKSKLLDHGGHVRSMCWPGGQTRASGSMEVRGLWCRSLLADDSAEMEVMNSESRRDPRFMEDKAGLQVFRGQTDLLRGFDSQSRLTLYRKHGDETLLRGHQKQSTGECPRTAGWSWCCFLVRKLQYQPTNSRLSAGVFGQQYVAQWRGKRPTTHSETLCNFICSWPGVWR